MTTATLHDLYRASLAAESAWEAEMRKVTTARLGDFRYTPAAKGEPGSPLRLAHDEFRRANDARYQATQATWINH